MGEAAAPLEGVKHLAPQICHHGWQISEDTAAPCAQHVHILYLVSCILLASCGTLIPHTPRNGRHPEALTRGLCNRPVFHE